MDEMKGERAPTVSAGTRNKVNMKTPSAIAPVAATSAAPASTPGTRNRIVPLNSPVTPSTSPASGPAPGSRLGGRRSGAQLIRPPTYVTSESTTHKIGAKIQATATAALTPRRKSVFKTRESVVFPPDTPIVRTAAPCPKWCGACLYANHPLPDEPTAWQGLIDLFRCPPHRYPAKLIYALILIFFFTVTLFGIFDDDMYPGGTVFTIFFMEVMAFIGGEIIQVIGLPALLGMLLTGILFRNLPITAKLLGTGEQMKTSYYVIRSMALGIILTRAGLGLNPTALRRLSFVCFRLAFTPCIVETIAVAIASHFLLDMEWMWSLMLGFALAAVSPAVVVPGMLMVQKQNLSVVKGIPTLLIASSSIDDVLAIGGFGICMSITFSTESVLMSVLHGPIEVCIGLTYGTVLGILLWYFPDPLSGRPRYVAWLRMALLLFGSMSGLFGSRKIGFPGAGAMSCMVLAFVSAYNWREDFSSAGLREISHQYARLWLFFQPMLFGLVGCEINIKDMKPETVGLGLGVIAIGLTTRACAAFLCVWGCDFNLKERLFIALAWLPKATVQAAMGPVALDHVRTKHPGIGGTNISFIDGNSTTDMTQIEEKDEMFAKTILHVTTLAILISAPLGAIAIAMTARTLLTHDDDADDEHKQHLAATESESHLLQDMLMKSQEHHLHVPDVVESKDDRISSLTAVPPGHEYREFLTGLSETEPKRSWWSRKKGRHS